ncbi:MAG: ATP-binding protein [bacterium]
MDSDKAQPGQSPLTFLFSDIEGSTTLWDEKRHAMQAALARHDALMRGAIESHRGRVVKQVGDSFHAVFGNPADAVAAVLSAQRALAAEPWGDTGLLKVRMAVHTGPAEERDNDFFGPALNRCSRLLGIGYGGQVLLSEAATALVRDALPAGASLRDLRSHRLKDLQHPEHVFQLVHPDLPSDFPPLRSLTSLPNNLPRQSTSFVGREKPIADLKEMLSQGRLVTLIGPGGVGKTRLALQVAADLLTGDGHGVWLVELAPLSDAALIPQTVAAALGLREEPKRPITDTLLEYLRDKNILIILDNCEHLVEACAQLADEALSQCPQTHLMATSREALGVRGEQIYRVPSLSLPPTSPTRPTGPTPPAEVGATDLSHYESIRLFVDRARLAQSDFALTPTRKEAVTDICRRLDGIPLAIELAAARVKAMSVEQIRDRLNDRFRLLTGGSRTALERHQTLRAGVDWSYTLLAEEEKKVLRAVSVFVGGFTLDAAGAVCGSDALDPVTRLVEKSLVNFEEEHDPPRYALLETIRQYAREKLDEAGEGPAARNGHLAFFVALAEEAEPELTGANQAEWLNRLEAEHENLRAALDWALEAPTANPESRTPNPALMALRIAGALWRFWEVRGYLNEGGARLAAAIESSQESGVGSQSVGARGAVPESQTILAKALNGAGALAYWQGDYAAARDLHQQALTIRRELGDRRGIAGSLNNLGNVAWFQADYAAARRYQEESLAIARELGDKRGIAASLNNLGLVAQGQGDYAAARRFYDESLALFRDIDDKGSIAASLTGLGNVALKQCNLSEAQSLLKEAIGICRDIGDKRGIAYSFEDFAHLNQTQGNSERAAKLLGTVDALREAIGAPLPPSGRAAYDRTVAAVRAALADAAFNAAFAAGRALPLDSAIAYALEGDPPAP